MYGAEETLQLATTLGQLLLEQQQTLATAESCTGGYLAHCITQVPGASAYYQGGSIAYQDTVKVNLLDVPIKVLQQHGAVSEAIAVAMARGVQERLGATLGMATTGFVGPTGGTPQAPVGTVWLAVATPDSVHTQQLHLTGARVDNIRQVTQQALALLVHVLRVS